MSLAERIARRDSGPFPPAPVLAAARADEGVASDRTPPRHSPQDWVESELSTHITRIRTTLYRELGTQLYDASSTPEELHELAIVMLRRLMDDNVDSIPATDREIIFAAVRDDVIGHGPIQGFLNDPDISEVMVSGTSLIYVERRGKLIQTTARFETEEHLRRVIERICAGVGRRIDESSPMVDARLADGSRVNAVIPPLAVRGSALTIRKFSETPLTIEQLISMGSLTKRSAALLEGCVLGRLNIVVSGGTGTGKTTMLNVLSGFIPGDQRIVTIEDSVELQLRQEHVITLETRPANVEGRGQITIRDLVKNSLRMRPDRIVIGECRGAEALDMLQAMNTGHEGSLTTGHANSPRDMVSRLETMVLTAGLDLPIRAIRDQIAGAVDLIVQLTRLNDGRRAVTAICEVQGMESDIITLSNLFDFNWDTATLEPTGIRPLFESRIAAHGVTLDSHLFHPARRSTDHQ